MFSEEKQIEIPPYSEENQVHELIEGHIQGQIL